VSQQPTSSHSQLCPSLPAQAGHSERFAQSDSPALARSVDDRAIADPSRTRGATVLHFPRPASAPSGDARQQLPDDELELSEEDDELSGEDDFLDGERDLSVDVGPAGSRRPGDEQRCERVRDLLTRMVGCTDPDERRRLQGQVVIEHLAVAKSIASRYRGRGVERGDLEQLAYLGLVKAAGRWLPGRSEDFLQFAVPTISGEIKRYFRDHSWLVRPPRRIQELRAAIGLAERDAQGGEGIRSSDANMGQRIGVSETAVREARIAAGLCRPPSLDAPGGAGMMIAQHWGPRTTGCEASTTSCRWRCC